MTEPTSAKACLYEPFTGPVPDDLKPGETFFHRRVRLDKDFVAPMLLLLHPAVELNETLYHTINMRLEHGPQIEYGPDNIVVMINAFGLVIKGGEFLAAVRHPEGLWLEVDFLHNVPVVMRDAPVFD